MLLQSLIQNQQSAYSDIQAQIESLQEQQRHIQAFLQQLGSVKSQMLSAAQMVSEAVASIREVCPDELNNYQDTITGLFGDAAIAQLTASLEAEEPAPEAPQQSPSPEDKQTIDVVAEAQPENNTVALIEEVETLAESLTWNQYRKFVNEYPLNGRITQKSKAEIKAMFAEYLQGLNADYLGRMIASLRNV
ncbi:MAG TPA: hypothetical protein VE956_02125 [Nodularia sp. (in: cyanobacteria)]|nr:hypothetical protein [Nodularia sp. (in: cyanobacteria)]